MLYIAQNVNLGKFLHVFMMYRYLIGYLLPTNQKIDGDNSIGPECYAQIQNIDREDTFYVMWT